MPFHLLLFLVLLLLVCLLLGDLFPCSFNNNSCGTSQGPPFDHSDRKQCSEYMRTVACVPDSPLRRQVMLLLLLLLLVAVVVVVVVLLMLLVLLLLHLLVLLLWLTSCLYGRFLLLSGALLRLPASTGLPAIQRDRGHGKHNRRLPAHPRAARVARLELGVLLG